MIRKKWFSNGKHLDNQIFFKTERLGLQVVANNSIYQVKFFQKAALEVGSNTILINYLYIYKYIYIFLKKEVYIYT